MAKSFRAVDFINLKNMAELSRQLAYLQQQVDQSTDDLDALEPPKDAQEDNDKIVAALRTFSVELGKMKQAADARDGRRVLTLGHELSGSGKGLEKAVADLESKGYETGEFSP